jgi:hypothetical protein
VTPATANQHAELPAGYVGSAVAAFATGELIVAVTLAFAIEILFFAVLVRAGSTAEIREERVAEAKPIPIAVKPVLDDTPLLKLGGKKVRTKLPDMWKKQAPIKRFKARSAPSPDAEDSVDAIPKSEVATGDAGVPPPDAEVAKEVDEDIEKMDASPDVESNVEGEGSPDGVKEGTETDPLKARAVSLYRAKLINWFNRKWRVPTDISCEELATLSAGAVANVGGDRSVVAYTVTRPSGNASFDASVRAAMDSSVGQVLPPPPPNYPDILGGTVSTGFHRSKKCDSPSP